MPKPVTYPHYLVSWEVKRYERDPWKEGPCRDVVVYWVTEFYPLGSKEQAEKRFKQLMAQGANVRFMSASMIAHHQPSEVK